MLASVLRSLEPSARQLTQVDTGENGRGVGGLLKINLCFIMPGNLSGRLATGAYVQFSSVASQC